MFNQIRNLLSADATPRTESQWERLLHEEAKPRLAALGFQSARRLTYKRKFADRTESISISGRVTSRGFSFGSGVAVTFHQIQPLFLPERDAVTVGAPLHYLCGQPAELEWHAASVPHLNEAVARMIAKTMEVAAPFFERVNSVAALGRELASGWLISRTPLGPPYRDMLARTIEFLEGREPATVLRRVAETIQTETMSPSDRQLWREFSERLREAVCHEVGGAA